MADRLETCDVFVVGGGINGCGIARDAAGRGFSVQLAEMGDLAGGTSSAATKLIHGGLRYLEQYRFRLVREALREREVLWRNAPHVIRPLRFVLPHHNGLRPAWLLRLGLFLYDHIGGRRLLPPTRALDLARDPAGRPLKAEFTRGFEYSDCWADDARLVVLNAVDAAARGAMIRTRTEVTAIRRDGGLWRITLRERASGAERTFGARLLVNAAGPWADILLGRIEGRSPARNVRLVRGSHIVLPRLFAHERAYIFQNADGRVVFAIPFEEDYTLIGTTDREHEGDPAEARIAADETAYLRAAASAYFRAPVREEDIVWTYSGVRPLYDDGASSAQEASREYVLRVEGQAGEAPLVNVFGGKLTTYRRLAEAAMARIERALGARGPRWTHAAPLPGGDFPVDGVAAEERALMADYPFLEARHARRLVRCYGTLARAILGAARQASDLGRHFGADLYEAELRHLVANEWARSADDILWRRTKAGLRLSPAQAAAVAACVAELASEGAAAVTEGGAR